jgi:beta-lactamase regulating signal transducer with metallopeptidase domain
MPGLWWFAETTLVAAVLAVLAALAGRLRSIGPTVRHALWLVVLVKLLTPPLVSWPWPVPWQNLKWLTISLEAVSAPTPTPVGDFELPRFARPFPNADRLDNFERKTVLVSADDDGDACDLRTVVAEVPAPSRRYRVWLLETIDTAAVSRAVLILWLVVSLAVGAAQAIRIVRFSRELRGAVPAPDDLIEETEGISQRLGLRPPELLVVPNLVTPMLWCLGCPKLLLPGRLVKSLPIDHWRGILTHELAHLRRGDHWVSRLELAASLIWWWNPLYWLTRARLDAEAELACDAWVVWALPKDRLTYAEVLLDICTTLSLVRPPAPKLGVTGSGRFFERRLTMILQDHVPCRPSPLGVLAACLLALFALPSWTAAQPASSDPEDERASISLVQTDDQGKASIVDDDDDERTIGRTDDDDDDDEDDDGDDDEDDEKAAAKAKRRAEVAKARAEAAKVRAEARAKARAAAKKKGKGAEPELEADLSRIEKEIEAKLAPIEKEIEAKLAPLEKEIEAKFGPEFEKKMAEIGEKIGKEIGAKLGSGSEFEKKMSELGVKVGKEMQGKFGPGSEFEKKMEAFGKEMEAKFGPGSEFQKKMEAFGKEMEAKFGPDSEFQKKLKEQRLAEIEHRNEPSEKPSASPSRASENAKFPPTARDRRRERRINEIEAQIRKLMDELKALKEDGGRN